MRIRFLCFLPVKILLIFALVSCSVTSKKNFRIFETTDVHGVILPYDFIEKQKLNFSMASTYNYIKQKRSGNSNTLLLDNGDNLQGQPEVYYYNFIDTVSPHFLAEVMNYMGYDACTVGNHDIEAGHAVYDRLVKEYKFPLLAANAVNIKQVNRTSSHTRLLKRMGSGLLFLVLLPRQYQTGCHLNFILV